MLWCEKWFDRRKYLYRLKYQPSFKLNSSIQYYFYFYRMFVWQLPTMIHFSFLKISFTKYVVHINPFSIAPFIGLVYNFTKNGMNYSCTFPNKSRFVKNLPYSLAFILDHLMICTLPTPKCQFQMTFHRQNRELQFYFIISLYTPISQKRAFTERHIQKPRKEWHWCFSCRLLVY